MKKLDETGGKPADMKDPFSQQVIREEIVEEVLVPIKRAAPADPAAPSWAAHGPTLPDAEQKDAYDKSHLRCWKFRNHPMVVRALSRWWGVNENSFDDLDGDGVMDLTCDQYLSILRRVAKALIHPSNYDPEEVEDAARDDWAEDSHGLKYMEKEYFMDAIFELVDVWMPDWCDEPHEMEEFLDKLLGRCSGGAPRIWLDDHEIEYGGYEEALNEPEPESNRLAGLDGGDGSGGGDGRGGGDGDGLEYERQLVTREVERVIEVPNSGKSGLFDSDKGIDGFDWSMLEQAEAAERLLEGRMGETEEERLAREARNRAQLERIMAAKRAAFKLMKRLKEMEKEGTGLTIFVDKQVKDVARPTSPFHPYTGDPLKSLHDMRLRIWTAEDLAEAARLKAEAEEAQGRAWLFTPNARGTQYTGRTGSPIGRRGGRSPHAGASSLFVGSDEFGGDGDGAGSLLAAADALGGWEARRLTVRTYLDAEGNVVEADADALHGRPIGSRRGTPDGGPLPFGISPRPARPRTPALEWSNFAGREPYVLTGHGASGGGLGASSPRTPSPRSPRSPRFAGGSTPMSQRTSRAATPYAQYQTPPPPRSPPQSSRASRAASRPDSPSGRPQRWAAADWGSEPPFPPSFDDGGGSSYADSGRASPVAHIEEDDGWLPTPAAHDEGGGSPLPPSATSPALCGSAADATSSAYGRQGAQQAAVAGGRRGQHPHGVGRGTGPHSPAQRLRSTSSAPHLMVGSSAAAAAAASTAHGMPPARLVPGGPSSPHHRLLPPLLPLRPRTDLGGSQHPHTPLLAASSSAGASGARSPLPVPSQRAWPAKEPKGPAPLPNSPAGRAVQPPRRGGSAQARAQAAIDTLRPPSSPSSSPALEATASALTGDGTDADERRACWDRDPSRPDARRAMTPSPPRDSWPRPRSCA